MVLLLLNAILILATVAAVHLYLYKRLVKDVSRKGGVWRCSGTATVWLLSAVSVGAMVAGPADAPFHVVRALEGPGIAWLVLLPYLVVALLLGEAVRPLLRGIIAHRAERAFVPDPPQRDHPTEETNDENHNEASGTEGKSFDDKRENFGTSRRIFISRTVGIGAITLGGGDGVS